MKQFSLTTVSLGLVIALSTFTALVAAGRDQGAWSAAGVIRLPEGTPAPPVALKDPDGRSIDLRDFRGQIVMLYFWATW